MSTATNGRVINVEQAALRTATITVRALTIDKRQVTLAVFRQLIRKPVLNRETGEFFGLPWGTVNYHPDRCADAGSHLHVVWQDGNELRRATESPPDRFYSSVDPGVRTDWLVLAVDEGWRPDRWESRNRVTGCWVQFAPYPAIFVPSPVYEESALNLGNGLPGYVINAQLDRNRKRAEETREFLKGRANGNARKWVADCIRRTLATDYEYWTTVQERWRELNALPQLFIAT